MFDYIIENSTNANMIFERNGAGRTPMEIAAGSSRLIDMAKHIVDLRNAEIGRVFMYT